MICTHCGQEIARDDTLGDWFHTGRDSSDIDMMCDPAKGWIPHNIAKP